MSEPVEAPEANERIEHLVTQYRAEREALDFLDSNLWVGRPQLPSFCKGWQLGDLLTNMDRYGIRGGIISHNAAVIEDPYLTNQELLEELKEHEQLWGALVVTTELPDGYANWHDYLAWAVSRGARMVRLFPKTHRFSLARWCSGALLGAINEHRLILTLWHIEAGWEAIKMLCDTYPHLPVLVEGRPRKILYHLRYFYPLLERYPNLHLEMHNLNVYLGIEDIVERFGADHLVYGSCMPFNDPNVSQMMVTGARIDDRAKRMIARDNLERLLEGVAVP